MSVTTLNQRNRLELMLNTSLSLRAADAFEGEVSDPQSLHKYAYVHGDPLNGIDPTGESRLGVTVGVIAIGLGLAAAAVRTFSPIIEGTESFLEKASAVGWGGKDITAEMKRLKAQMRARWPALTSAEKDDIIQTTSRVFYTDESVFERFSTNPFGLNTKAFDSWDVKELASLSEQGQFESDGPNYWVPRSVTVDGNVHLAHEVNYFFYGYLHGMAWAENSSHALDQQGLESRIHLYRPAAHLFFNVREQREFDGSAFGRVAWAQAGWQTAVRESQGGASGFIVGGPTEHFVTPGREHSIPRGIPNTEQFNDNLQFRAVGFGSSFYVDSRPMSVAP